MKLLNFKTYDEALNTVLNEILLYKKVKIDDFIEFFSKKEGGRRTFKLYKKSDINYKKTVGSIMIEIKKKKNKFVLKYESRDYR